MVGDIVSTCPLHISKVVFVWCRFPSHLLSLTGANSDRWFAAPMGAAVWLATIV
jgi:hypothetical protein